MAPGEEMSGSEERFGLAERGGMACLSAYLSRIAPQACSFVPHPLQQPSSKRF
jgi:hypothetical protein